MATVIIFFAALLAILFFMSNIVFKGLNALIETVFYSETTVLILTGILIFLGEFTIYTIYVIAVSAIKGEFGLLIISILFIGVFGALIIAGIGIGIQIVIFLYNILIFISEVLDMTADLCGAGYSKMVSIIIEKLKKY